MLQSILAFVEGKELSLCIYFCAHYFLHVDIFMSFVFAN